MAAETCAPIALSWLLTYLVHSTLLIAAIALVTRCLPRAAMGAREALWKLALVGGIGTASIQLACQTEPWFGRVRVAAAAAASDARAEPDEQWDAPAAAFEACAPASADEDGATETPAPAEFSLVEASGAAATSARPRGGPRAPLDAALEPVAGAVPPSEELALDPRSLYVAGVLDGAGAGARALWERLRAQDWRVLLLGAWIAGAALGLLSLARAWRRLHFALRWRSPLESGALRDELDALCDEAGHRGRVRLSCATGIGAPVAFGLVRPEICVPVRAIGKLTRGQQRGMLAHELAHVRRRDPSWLLFTRVLEALLFVQPLNRIARRGIEDASEYLCDDFAARRGGGLALASCLAEIAGWLVPATERRALQLAVGMARQPSRLTHRIERLLVEEEREERLLWLAPVGLCACSLLVFVAPGFSPGHALETEAIDAPLVEALELAALEPLASGGEEPVEASAELAPRGAMTDALGALDAEIETLAREVDALRADLERRNLTRRFATQLAVLEARLNELSTRRTRLREVLRLLSAVDAGARDASDTDPLSAPGAAAHR